MMYIYFLFVYSHFFERNILIPCTIYFNTTKYSEKFQNHKEDLIQKVSLGVRLFSSFSQKCCIFFASMCKEEKVFIFQKKSIPTFLFLNMSHEFCPNE